MGEGDNLRNAIILNISVKGGQLFERGDSYYSRKYARNWPINWGPMGPYNIEQYSYYNNIVTFGQLEGYLLCRDKYQMYHN